MKVINKYILRAVFVVFALVFFGCRVQKEKVQTTAVKVPNQFVNAMDSSLNFELLHYKRFFTDTILVNHIALALQNNYDVKIALSKITQAKAQFKVKKYALFPSLDARLGAGVTKFGDFTMDGVGNYDGNLSPNVFGDRIVPNPVPDFVVGFESSWELDLWGKLKNLKKSAYNQFLASNEGKNLIQNVLINQVAINYYTLIALDKKLSIAQSNSALQKQVLELVKTLKEGGRNNELAVKQVEAQYLNTLSLEKILEKEILFFENELSSLLGSFSFKVERAVDFPEVPFIHDFTHGVPSDLIANRPDVKAHAYILEASEADFNAAKAAFLPSLTIRSFMGVQAFRSSVLFSLPNSIAYNLVSGLAQPVFNRYALKANFNIQKQNQQIALYGYEKTVINAFNEIVTHLNNITLNKSVLDYKFEEVNVLKEAIKISNTLFLSGKANYIEVITSQKNVLQEEINFIDYLLQQVISNISLYQAIGGGDIY